MSAQDPADEESEGKVQWMTFDEFGEPEFVLWDVDACEEGQEAFLIADEDSVVELPWVADAREVTDE